MQWFALTSVALSWTLSTPTEMPLPPKVWESRLRSRIPYLRYGIMLGNRQHDPLPGRLYRHGTQFDCMISFREHDPSPNELETFRKVLMDEVEASRALERMIYESRMRDRDHHTLFHRRLVLDDIGGWSRTTLE